MADFIACRRCDSRDCQGCNIYTLAAMLTNGVFDSLMDDHHCIRPVAEVEEVKHGEWAKSKWGYPDRTLTCSRCGFEYDSADYKHPKAQQELLPGCPQCRAKMDGGDAQ